MVFLKKDLGGVIIINPLYIRYTMMPVVKRKNKSECYKASKDCAKGQRNNSITLLYIIAIYYYDTFCVQRIQHHKEHNDIRFS